MSRLQFFILESYSKIVFSYFGQQYLSENCTNIYKTIYVYALKCISYESAKLEPCPKDWKEIILIKGPYILNLDAIWHECPQKSHFRNLHYHNSSKPVLH
jgi:hypothetical protein